MDHSGIGSALDAVARVYFRSARQSGRSTNLLNSLKSGDRVIFKTAKDAERFKKLALAQGKDIETISATVNETGLDKIHHQMPAQGRTIFDHEWVEDRYLHVIEGERKFIDRMQKNFSGPHVAHVEDEVDHHDRKWMRF